MNEKEVLDILRRKGKQMATAMELGISRSYLSEILQGRHKIPKQVLDHLGLEPVVIYRKKEDGKSP